MKGGFKTRGELYMKKDKLAQKRHDILRTAQLVFPNGVEKIPLTCRFALWILRRNKAHVVDALVDKQEGIKKAKK